MKLADVAAKAGVSLTTVSRVLNEDQYVKGTTRAKVLRAMEQLKYYPNLHARSLAKGKSHTIGVIVSNLDNPFFLDIFRRIETLAYRNGFDVLVVATHYDPVRLQSCVRAMIGRRVYGIAAITSEMAPSLVDELSNADVPVVFYDVGRAGKRITNIKLDYRQGMRQLVEYLYSLGHRRMAFVAYPGHLAPTEDRRIEFLEAMVCHQADAKVVVLRSDGFEEAREAAYDLLESGFEPTAILCVNDLTAIGVLRCLADRGIAVPDQISVAGFDNIGLAQFTVPSLTTIHIPRDTIGQMAFDALVPVKQSPSIMGLDLVVKPELIVRQSTGPCRRS